MVACAQQKKHTDQPEQTDEGGEVDPPTQRGVSLCHTHAVLNTDEDKHAHAEHEDLVLETDVQRAQDAHEEQDGSTEQAALAPCGIEHCCEEFLFDRRIAELGAAKERRGLGNLDGEMGVWTARQLSDF